MRIGFIMMDLDNFKDYNDNYGHVAGDECLSIVAKTFSKNANEDITVYRYGGEEFIALLSDSVCDNTWEIAENLRKGVENQAIPHAFSNAGNIVTVSLGIYVGKPAGHDRPMSFVERADKAMYHSKQTGRNRCTIEYK